MHRSRPALFRRAKLVNRERRLAILSFERLEDRHLLATVAVSNTLDVTNGDTSSISALLGDDGDDGISLREAILAANATTGKDFIDFNIPASDPGHVGGVWTIQPTSQLPTITDAVEINGYSQAGASENSDEFGINGELTIELDGSGAGGVIGLDITAGGSTVRGLVINRFGDAAILLRDGGGNFIEGNFLGTEPNGTDAAGNRIGVLIEPSSLNTIGGGSPAARNLISGNNSTGVEIANSASFGNRVQGNFIGTDRTGLAPLGNGLDGILLTGDISQTTYATDNTIGGTGSGEGNVISGNLRNGVQIVRGTFNTVAGNSIGTNVLGNAPLPNAFAGVLISEGADNVIGGIELGAENIISGNTFFGVRIAAGNLAPNQLVAPRDATRNKVQGNAIGTDFTGQSAIPNLGGGVLMDTAAGSTVTVFDNTIGGTTDLSRNVISGNGTAGVIMATSLVVQNKLQGNYIGTNAAGEEPLSNQGPGVFITELIGIDGAPAFNVIGGTESGAGNLISGNLTNGVEIAFDATGNLIQGNFIGTNFDGMQALGNQLHGVAMYGGTLTRIGGYDGDDGEQDGEVLARNIISGNQSDGIYFGNDVDHVASGNIVVGNYIGTNAEGTGPVANNRGVEIEDAIANVIGTAPPDGPIVVTPDIPDGANLISGNGELGVLILGEMAMANRVDANYIGTNKTATGQIGNGGPGIHIQSAPENHIGSAVAGGGNVIGGNLHDGVTILLDGAQGNVLHNNRIGYVGNDGQTPVVIPNQGIGVNIIDAPANVIGGVGENMRNVISGNVASGVAIQGPLADANQVLGNYIGTDDSGMVAAPNLHGVNIENAGNNVIGDGQAGASNVLSGNVIAGVLITGTTAANNKVQGNLIGLNADGSAALPNNTGVAITGGADNNIVGTDADGASDADERNVISGNQGIGVQIVGSVTFGNRIAGNYIGTSTDGLTSMGNQFGVVIASGARGNIVGGSGNSANQNVISGNRESGVSIAGGDPDVATRDNFVTDNYIGTAANGEDPLGNAHYGVLVNDANRTSILRNTIAFNGDELALKGHGVAIAAGIDNKIQRNSIHHNAGRGIDLGNANDSLFKTINDAGDGDSGANNLQNYPVATRVEFNGDMKRILWHLDGVNPGQYVFDFFSNSTLDPSGFGEGENYLGSTPPLSSLTDTLEFSVDFPVTDEWISATVTDPTGNTSEFSLIDTDGDALADAWELIGIDVNEDGTSDFDPLILKGASHLHKDIFVEIDAMDGRAPSQDALDMVAFGRPTRIEGFANAPNSLVQNPDGMDGINLHLEMEGDVDITRQPWTDLDPDNDDWPLEFDRIKNGGAEPAYPDGRFGTPDERGNPNWEHIREARTLVYRYAIFADSVPSNPHLGKSEFGGDDLYSVLGNSSTRGGNPEDQAGVLMHELGHTLGLQHGGADESNFKPNYYSIMNYIWALEPQHPETQFGFAQGWRLDYSRATLPTLDESALLELIGFGGDPNILVPIGPVFDAPLQLKYELVAMGGPIDLNGNGLLIDSVERDINFLDDTDDDGVIDEQDATPGDLLVGHEDWSQLKYNFTQTSDFASNVHENLEQQPYTLELYEQINSAGLGPGVIQFSHEFYGESEAAGAATIRVVRGGGTDGVATVAYSVTAGTASAGEDFTVVSGVLEFADGEFRKTFTIPLVDDDDRELDESVILTLETPTGGAVVGGRDTAELSILNDDLPTLVGDYNENGAVDAADYTAWRRMFGLYIAAYNGADGNGNGIVDQADYDTWKENFGNTLQPGAATLHVSAAESARSPILLATETDAEGASSLEIELMFPAAALAVTPDALSGTSLRTRSLEFRQTATAASSHLMASSLFLAAQVAWLSESSTSSLIDDRLLAALAGRSYPDTNQLDRRMPASQGDQPEDAIRHDLLLLLATDCVAVESTTTVNQMAFSELDRELTHDSGGTEEIRLPEAVRVQLSYSNCVV